MAEKTLGAVAKYVRDNDVKFIRLWFTDILGQLKSFTIPEQELEKAATEGMGFDGSSIQGFARIDESDMIAKPDESIKVGDSTVAMQEILDKIQLKKG